MIKLFKYNNILIRKRNNNFIRFHYILNSSLFTMSETLEEKAQISNIKEEPVAKKKRTKSKENKNLRPNNFFAIQISNPEIHKALKNVQNSIISKEGGEILKNIIVPCTEFHITLNLAHFKNEEIMNKAIQLVNEKSTDIKDLFQSGIIINVEELKTFNNKVLYASIKKDEAYDKLEALYRILRLILLEMDGSCLCESDFKPHITLMKIAKKWKLLKSQGIVTIDQTFYEEFLTTHFGKQTIYNVQLLSIAKPRDNKGYYALNHQWDFECLLEKSENHSECCKEYYIKDPEKVDKFGVTLKDQDQKSESDNEYNEIYGKGLNQEADNEKPSTTLELKSVNSKDQCESYKIEDGIMKQSSSLPEPKSENKKEHCEEYIIKTINSENPSSSLDSKTENQNPPIGESKKETI